MSAPINFEEAKARILASEKPCEGDERRARIRGLCVEMMLELDALSKLSVDQFGAVDWQICEITAYINAILRSLDEDCPTDDAPEVG